ncbi:PD-(D/E)XK nuclease family protein [Nocardia sp. CDC159]|uniref:DNA 3'-5' helicase n=1 Tax=Nocardia pulmonis TaxID=2951408 RepID=A0A9X2E7B6_9NOCA|nr:MULTISPECIES: PD-(D/E)XK nuclease family protein [Nocardia]MCM6775647.1 PD-(D/E)XK nuclease family protein [Nocardia pulmonis]MCM6788377.1 PD-(D/E)XK nuclease family protein [Nocardia sp. CDC159]
MRSDSSVRLVRRGETAPRLREWGADVRTLFAGGGADPGWRPWQVLGGPGTGKTSLLIDVAADRIADGADPESILVLTHSKGAALRVRNAIGRQLGGVPGATREPLVRTVHSYAFAILRMHAAAHGNPPPRLLTGAEQDVVLREMLRGELEDIANGAEDLWPQRLQPALGTLGFAEQLRDLMLRATERGMGPEDLVELGRLHDRPEWEAAGRFLERYEQAMLLRWSVGIEAPEATAPALDAAELVGAALDALALDPRLLDAERERIRCLLVDDAQHLDPLAAQLVRAVGGGPATAVVAGDPDQAVFTFRGAEPRFLADLDAPEDRRIVLRDNRRSAAAVHDAAARIAARMPGSAPHRFDPRDPAAPENIPGEVRVRVLTTPAKEASLIADHLRRAHLTDGVPWSRMAVVVRSVPLSLAPLRRALLAAGVPVLQPKPDVPLARRRGASWLLLSLRALLAADRTPALFTPDDALDLLTGPLGGADQISLRRLRRGIRRTLLERVRYHSDDPRAFGGEGNEGRAGGEGNEGRAGGEGNEGRAGGEGSGSTASSGEESGAEAGDRRPELPHGGSDVLHLEDDAARVDAAEGAGLGEAGRGRRGSVVDEDFDWEGGVGEWGGDLDRSSAEVLRDLIVGVGDYSIVERLSEVEGAPLRRVLKAVGRGRRAVRRGAGLEEVLWGVWTASNLEKRWVGQSERGGAVGMQADRDLDAAVGLFDAAAAYVDRLPGADIEGFVGYLEQQEIPQDSAPLTDPGEAVAIVSAHAAAGREWDVVAVAGVQEGIWPNLRPRGTLLGVEDLVDLVAGVADSGERVSRAAPILAEERRLLLLACSRARRSLLVTAVESVSGDRDLVPSRFLAELDPDATPGETGRIPAPIDPGRALITQALIAELRGAACDPEEPARRRQRAARQLARLARAGVRGAHPDDWYGTVELSSQLPLWGDDEGPVALSPSTVELLKTCPLRWALERHGGSDGENPHAVKGNLVHTLVQALAGQVTEAQVKAALVKAWKAVDPTSTDTGPHSWHSRQELRRTESMLDTFLAWLRNTRDELTQMGVEVPVDCVLPARGPGEYPVRIRGRVDRVERDAFGRFVIVDIKTGKTPISKQAAQDHAQLATYQVAAAAGALDDGSADAEPGGARLVYVAKPSGKEGATQRLQPPLEDEGIEQWRDTIHDAAAATRGPSYLAMRNDGCRHCTVSGSCPVQDTGRQVTDT